MKFEIKKFQSMRTDDGGGFSFDLYIDGVKAAFVIDEGNGGGVWPRWFDRMHGLSDLEKKFNEYVATLPPIPLPEDALESEKSFYPRPMDAETFLCQLVDDFEAKRQLRRWCSKKTVFRLPEDKVGEYRTINRKFDAQVRDQIRRKYPTAIIENEVV